MSKDLYEYLNPPKLVQEKKKYANFTVTPIGGPAEIIKWRQQQEAKESLVRLKLAAKDERIAAFESEIGQKLDTPRISGSTWAEKQAFATSERARLSQQEKSVTQFPPWEATEPPKKTIIQRVFGFFKSIWHSAGF